ncbi:phage portal protein [Endozoicomonas lisbonensis]|uniref:phage portal protein n=1 Tax=Endozoicomonas lisbonensis TaxID=3120522 RepID=UPI003396ECB3
MVEPITFYGPDNQPLAGYSGSQGGSFGELDTWQPQAKMADAALLPNLELGNARSEDLARNHGIASGGVQLHVDNIVGHMFKLSYKPMWKRLGMKEEDAREFAKEVEAAWLEYAEDPVNCWIDAEGKRTFTMLIREAVATHTRMGEVMSTAEYIARPGTNMRTAIKVVNPHRVSNPNNAADTQYLRGGVGMNRFGAAVKYHVRDPVYTGFGDSLSAVSGNWRPVWKTTKWGRLQFLHVFEPEGDGSTRGANKFLSVMERLKMLDKFQSTQLQNAIVNAMYAATIESSLSSEDAFRIIGEEHGGDNKVLKYLKTMGKFHEGTGVRLGGVKIPHLFPGESLNLETPGNTAQGFAEFETAMLRYVAAGLNVSYEQLARDYSKVSYSSARASIMESWRYFMGRRKVIAARYASMIFSLWLEEALDKGIVTPPAANRDFYEAKNAWCNASWIGSGRLAIDGLKEVKEAVLRIEAGLSSYEREVANMGEDYQEIFQQQVREMKERKEAGLPPPSWVKALSLAPEQAEPEEEKNAA